MQHTLFALQVFLALPEAGALHAELKKHIAQAPPNQGFAGKNAYYRHLANLIRPWTPRFERGVWDYIEDAEEAEEEWKGWTQGTVADALEPAGGPGGRGPYRAGRENMFVTVLALLVKGGPSDAFVCERCRMPDNQMWKRGALMHLIDGVSMLNFASVRADAIYVRPGLGAGAVSEQELGEEHYQYLRALVP